jgi:hypothetical protein
LIRILRLSFIVLVSIIIFSSCNQSPPTSPQSLIPDEDLINATHVTSESLNLNQSSFYFDKELYMGISSRVLLGQNNYSKTYALYRFSIYVPDTTLAYLRAGTAKVTRAWVTMKPTYMQGDSTAQFRFTGRQIWNDWGLVYFDRDSLETIKSGASGPNVISFTNNTPLCPTLKDSIQFDIEPYVVKEWIVYDSTDSSSPKNYGLLLEPTTSGKVLGFAGSTYGDTTTTNYLYVTITKDSWGDYVDTVAVTPYMDTHMTKHLTTYPQSDEYVYLEGSYSERGFLRFDLSKIPSNIILNKVVLTMQMDPSLSYQSSPTADSIGLTILADSTTKAYTSDSTTVTLITRSGNTFTGTITWMFQDWIQNNNSYPNHGIELYLYEDAATTSRIVLYGSKYPDKSKRPKLDIYYTQKN